MRRSEKGYNVPKPYGEIRRADIVIACDNVAALLREQVPHLLPERDAEPGQPLTNRILAGEPSLPECVEAMSVLWPIIHRTTEDLRAGSELPLERLREIFTGIGMYYFPLLADPISSGAITVAVSPDQGTRAMYRALLRPRVRVLASVEHRGQVDGQHVLGAIPPWFATAAASVSVVGSRRTRNRRAGEGVLQWLAAHAASVSVRSGSQKPPPVVVVTAQVHELERISLEEADDRAFVQDLINKYGIGGQA